MIGRLATARTDLTPDGQVEVRGELWQAHLQPCGEITQLPAGAPVLIKAVEDLTLIVEPT
jgi:membrane-bound serine protease (ClpP class)